MGQKIITKQNTRAKHLKKTFVITACLLGINACTPSKIDTITEHETAVQVAGMWTSKTLPELQSDLANGLINAEKLTQIYLDRIAAIDRSGPSLQSVLTLNPNAIKEAAALDAKQKRGEKLGPLHGIPVLIKDNIETKDAMPTSAGALALAENFASEDAPLISGLRDAGAIILGKTNLSQWANFRSTRSMSGWSYLGGQVKNPHILDRNPCGSSSGSAVAVAASLGAGAVGTETNGSIICPSTVNGIVGFKPTVGLVPQDGIIPISHSQDTAGPMTKTVRGAAMMLGAMASGDDTDFTQGLNADALKGIRVGVMNFAKGNNPDIHAAFIHAQEDMQFGGAIMVPIDNFTYPDNFGDKTLLLMEHEFKHGLNQYLAKTPNTVVVKSLSDLIAFNDKHRSQEMALFDQELFISSQERDGLTNSEYLSAKSIVQKATRQNGIDHLLAKYNVDVLIAPSGPVPSAIDAINGDVWPRWAGAGNLAATAGYPNLTIPMGNAHGLPMGISFMGAKNEDAKILRLGYAYEQATHHRIVPQFLSSASQHSDLKLNLKRQK